MTPKLFVLLYIMSFILSSQNAEPVVYITNPANNTIVDGNVLVAFTAIGHDLRTPTLLFSSGNSGVGTLLNNCAISNNFDTKLEQMDCTFWWDSTSFAGSLVNIQASVTDGENHVSDSIQVRVSGQ